MAKKKKDIGKTQAGSISIKRDGNRYTGEWKKSADVGVWKSLTMKWVVNVPGKKDVSDKDSTNRETTVRDTYSLPRSKFHPFAGKPVAYDISLEVQGRAEDGGKGAKSKARKKVAKFEPPAAPAVSVTFAKDSQTFAVSVKTDAGAGWAERHDTWVTVDAAYGAGGRARVLDAATASTDWSSSYKLSSYPADFQAGQTVRLTCTARARGIRGDSAPVSASYTVARPAPATIRAVRCADRTKPTEPVMVDFDAGRWAQTVTLQRRHGADGAWEDAVKLDSPADGLRTLYDSVGAAEPADGEHIWYRVKSERDQFDNVYSEPFRADALYFKSDISGGGAAPSTIGFVSLAADGADGLLAVVGHTDGTPADGTEFSWSADPDAWASTEEPDTYECTADDAESADASWAATQTLHIRGLASGTPYHVRARRYKDTDSGRVFGAYADWGGAVAPAARAGTVSLSAPAAVERGRGIPLTWTSDGGSAQEAWAVRRVGDPGAPIASGADSMGACTVPAGAYGDDGSISLYVTVTAGGASSDSAPRTVNVASAPALSMELPASIAALPLSVPFSCSAPARLLLVLSAGTSAQTASDRDLPDGVEDVYQGQALWTAAPQPEWSLGADGLYRASVEVPRGVALEDGGGYTLSARAEDAATGLSSPEVSAEASVAWAHQAPEPPGAIEVTPEVLEEDADGALTVTRRCTVALAPGDGWADGDVYDLYRGSLGGYALVASGLPGDASVVDDYAALGDGEYRVCSRTPDGDLSWADYGYELDAPALRLDWDGGWAEVPYNLSFSYSYEKDFEARAHLDGSVGGAWNPAVKGTASISGALVKGRDREAMESLLALADHAGPAFCRTPDGRAFECDVRVSPSDAHSSMASSLDLSVTRVDPSGAFMASVPPAQEGAAS